jgi:hypothetical protein
MPINHKLTRQEMIDAIRKGGSVMLPDGRHIFREAEVPAEAVLAAGDVNRLQVEHDRIAAEIEVKKAELEEVKGQMAKARDGKAAKTDAPAGTGGDASATADALAKAHTADELKALCDDNDCPHGTKAEMAAALAAKGVKPPE